MTVVAEVILLFWHNPYLEYYSSGVLSCLALERGRGGAGEQGSRGAGEQGSRGAGEQGEMREMREIINS
ncbi:hypothetical protein JYQ62_34225 [Nostoc sp. UHCC 0702]|nr:hypothetical protein JYQ62_34225 [Nostoc sp. UHCC 0702]